MIRFVAAVAAISAIKTRQRDRPCTQAVYPRLLRDSSLVQTAFAPSPASKNRSASYSNRMLVKRKAGRYRRLESLEPERYVPIASARDTSPQPANFCQRISL